MSIAARISLTIFGHLIERAFGVAIRKNRASCAIVINAMRHTLTIRFHHRHERQLMAKHHHATVVRRIVHHQPNPGAQDANESGHAGISSSAEGRADFAGARRGFDVGTSSPGFFFAKCTPAGGKSWFFASQRMTSSAPRASNLRSGLQARDSMARISASVRGRRGFLSFMKLTASRNSASGGGLAAGRCIAR